MFDDGNFIHVGFLSGQFSLRAAYFKLHQNPMLSLLERDMIGFSRQEFGRIQSLLMSYGFSALLECLKEGVGLSRGFGVLRRVEKDEENSRWRLRKLV